MLSGKAILITGGTGSFGNAFIRMTLEKFNPLRLVIYSLPLPFFSSKMTCSIFLILCSFSSITSYIAVSIDSIFLFTYSGVIPFSFSNPGSLCGRH